MPEGDSEEDRPRKGHPKKDRQSYLPAQEEEEEDEGFEQAQDTGEKLYCVCRQPERDGDEYLQCDACTEYVHALRSTCWLLFRLTFSFQSKAFRPPHPCPATNVVNVN